MDVMVETVNEDDLQWTLKHGTYLLSVLSCIVFDSFVNHGFS